MTSLKPKGAHLAASPLQGRKTETRASAWTARWRTSMRNFSLKNNPATRACRTSLQPKWCRTHLKGGLTIDVSKAHKRLRIREDEWRLLLFQHLRKFFHDTVCHLGARFSAAWWSRMGAVLIRICHQFLFIQHGGWLYVDDFLFRLEATTAPLMGACICCFLHLLGCPISWHNVALGGQLQKDWP